ncbi:MAG TPA: hypothetical protein PKM30_11140 [Saprospiraceae bacterium]|jgi:hypothetical protein|nr:MAG: hypothetical protein UZ08_BCD001001176 [Candidatus Parvibacillus calidus]HMY84189.1 hypothetical protein [Saprospiraceae bacterium]HMZ23554.1 hypothetical protein [Saprospiraceae bacterium]HNA76680.1 hypothetical protein [Saprospiraceae bacterium]HND74057.1 hypothetical protein [Saprospiraceae bacterium]
MKPVAKEVKVVLHEMFKDVRIWAIMLIVLFLLIFITRFPV